MWQRLGIVASVLWALIAGLYSLESTTDQAMNFAQASYNLCLEAPTPVKDCSTQFLTDFHSNDSILWPRAGLVALLPIPLAWLFCYIVFWVSRWVLAGRGRTGNSN